MLTKGSFYRAPLFLNLLDCISFPLRNDEGSDARQTDTFPRSFQAGQPIRKLGPHTALREDGREEPRPGSVRCLETVTPWGL